MYMPPVQIVVRDHRSFGRKLIIGTHVINNFDLDPPPTDEISIVPIQTQGRKSRVGP